jgi:hypothetical protein
MKTRIVMPVSPVANPDQQAAIEALANSASFRKAPALRELLLYLWAHRESPPSEYAIGTQVLGRKSDFDPKTDSAVRVHMSRLRARLKDHYANHPSESGFTVPPGEYRLAFRQDASAPVPLSRREFPWKLSALAASMVAGVLAVDDIRLRWRARPEPPSLDPFWLNFLQEGKTQTLIVPAPLFFRSREQPFLARDFRVNRPEDVAQSPYLNSLQKQFGVLEENRFYTVASDTLAASVVARYLEDRRSPATVLDSPSAGLEILSSRDAILFVGPGTSAQFPEIMDRLGYGFQPSDSGMNRGLLDRRNPGVEFPVTVHSPTRSTGHGLLALLPGKAPGTHVLVVASSFNLALASVLTIPGELQQLRQFREQTSVGKYFEAIIRYERSGDRILDARPVEIRRSIP